MSMNTTGGDGTLGPFNSGSVPNLRLGNGQIDVDWFSTLSAFNPQSNVYLRTASTVFSCVAGKSLWTVERALASYPIGDALPGSDPGEVAAALWVSAGAHYSDIFTPAVWPSANEEQHPSPILCGSALCVSCT